jgi:hypothetical protein
MMPSTPASVQDFHDQYVDAVKRMVTRGNEPFTREQRDELVALVAPLS